MAKVVKSYDKIFRMCCEAHEKWVQKHIGLFDQYLKDEMAHMFFKLPYIADEAWLETYIQELDITDEEGRDIKSLAAYMLEDKDWEGYRMDEFGGETIYPGPLAYLLRTNPEAVLATNDPGIVQKVREHAWEIANTPPAAFSFVRDWQVSEDRRLHLEYAEFNGGPERGGYVIKIAKLLSEEYTPKCKVFSIDI